MAQEICKKCWSPIGGQQHISECVPNKLMTKTIGYYKSEDQFNSLPQFSKNTLVPIKATNWIQRILRNRKHPKAFKSALVGAKTTGTTGTIYDPK